MATERMEPRRQPMRRLLTGIGVCLLIGLVGPVHAARIEFSAGRSATLHGNLYTDADFVELIGDDRLFHALRWAPAVSLGRIAARSNFGQVRLDHAVGIGAIGARAYLWRNLFFSFQFGVTDGKTDALSSPYEFVSSLGWQGGHWQLLLRHISNGDLHKPNHGETMLLAGVAF